MSDLESVPLLKHPGKSEWKKKYVCYISTAVLLLMGVVGAGLIAGSRKGKTEDGIACSFNLLTLHEAPLDSPVTFKGHAVKGSKGAVAVEAEECSNIGVDSKHPLLKILTGPDQLMLCRSIEKGRKRSRCSNCFHSVYWSHS